jgi:hypothetical protein
MRVVGIQSGNSTGDRRAFTLQSPAVPEQWVARGIAINADLLTDSALDFEDILLTCAPSDAMNAVVTELRVKPSDRKGVIVMDVFGWADRAAESGA